MNPKRIVLFAVFCMMLAASCSAEREQPNVVLVVVDALRTDQLGCHGYSRPASPSIDDLAADRSLLETATTQAPWTKASFSSLLSSPDPFRRGVMRWESVLLDLMKTGKRKGVDGKFLAAEFFLTECATKRRPATCRLRSGEWKIIVESLTSSIDLYNLEDDPGETYDLWGKGIDYGDILLSMIQQLPGVRLRGWRLAFTGVDKESSLQADLGLPQVGRFEGVETLTRQAGISIEQDPDGTGYRLTTVERGLHMSIIHNGPSSVPVSLEVSRLAGDIDYPVDYGADVEALMGERLLLTPEAGLGTPGMLKGSMNAGRLGVHIWWMPGEESAVPRETSPLSPEEVERLKSLG
jgi:hypothetical protein